MSRSWFFNSLFVLLFFTAAAAAVWDVARQPKTNILLITVESARFDAISAELTPRILQLAQRGTIFDNHRTASAWTGANIASILTGASVFRHGIHSHGVSAASNVGRPLAELSDAGWKTAGLQPFMLTDAFQGLGLSVEANESLYSWLALQRKSKTPFFLWYHYLDTHLPYDAVPEDTVTPPPQGLAERLRKVTTLPAIQAGSVPFEPTDRPFIHAAYSSQFRTFDAWFSALWMFLDKSGLLEDTVIILTTDHGEELLERGHVGHASTTRAGHLFEEIVHVPLIVWLPTQKGGEDMPKRIQNMSTHLDIMPTVFTLLELDSAWTFEGRNLFDLPRDRMWTAITSKAGFAEADPTNVNAFSAAIMDGRFKLQAQVSGRDIVKTTLFDLHADPAEKADISDKAPDTGKNLSTVLGELVRTMTVSAPTRRIGAATTVPEWIFPKRSETLRFDDLPRPLTLTWRGDPTGTYKLQYIAGTGPSALKGELSVDGLSKDFGVIERGYWDTYVVPYKTVRIRVGREPHWSPWITVEVRK